jgi:xanthine/CO dehydrogenase XdhC/CoxF family maturation factor
MDVLNTAHSWIEQGRKVAIATVIETWGSAPQPVGSQLVVDSDGNFEGAVSGGCVEGDVISAAQDMITTGGHQVLSYGVADETAWKVGLACGGKIRVLVEAVN